MNDKQEMDVANAKARYEMTISELENETEEFEFLRSELEKVNDEFEFLRSGLDEVNEEFEFLQELHEKRSSKLTQDVIKAWSAYQSARIDAELAKKHAASAIEFIKASMEEQQ